LNFKRKQVSKQRGRVSHRTAEAARALAVTTVTTSSSSLDAPVATAGAVPILMPVKPRSLLRIGTGQVIAKGAP